MTWGLDDETKRKVLELRHRGLSYTAIARELKLTKGQVAGILFRAGFTRPEKAPIRLVK